MHMFIDQSVAMILPQAFCRPKKNRLAAVFFISNRLVYFLSPPGTLPSTPLT